MKLELTIKIAEEFAKEKFLEFKDQGEIDFEIWHAKTIIKIALILAENKNVDKDILKIAAWLHDIGKIIEIKDHAKHSLEIIEKNFVINEKLKDCILNHGSDDTPKTEEGKIIKQADKLCILNPELVNILIKYNFKKIKEEDIEFVKKMTNKSIEFLKELDLNQN